MSIIVPTSPPIISSESSPNMFERAEFERAVTPEEVKQKNRIRYLEKSIEKMQLDHSESLIGLHNEIDRLSAIVSGKFNTNEN